MPGICGYWFGLSRNRLTGGRQLARELFYPSDAAVAHPGSANGPKNTSGRLPRRPPRRLDRGIYSKTVFRPIIMRVCIISLYYVGKCT